MAKSEYEGEYAGVGGVIQPAVKGHAELTASEKRLVNAVYRHRTAGIDENLPLDDLHRPAVDAVLDSMFDRTAGRTPDEALGDQVS